MRLLLSIDTLRIPGFLITDGHLQVLYLQQLGQDITIGTTASSPCPSIDVRGRLALVVKHHRRHWLTGAGARHAKIRQPPPTVSLRLRRENLTPPNRSCRHLGRHSQAAA